MRIKITINERNYKMNNIVKEIQMLIDTNQLDIAVHNLMDGSNKIQKLINTYIWSQQRLQDLILHQSKGEFMHWNDSYDRISTIDNLNSPWFYRDEEGNFYNVNENHLSELLIQIELMTQS